MQTKVIALAVSMIMLFSLCSCSTANSNQNNSQTTDSASTAVQTSNAEPASIQEELDYKNEAVGYGIAKFPEAFKSQNTVFVTDDISGDSVMFSVYFVFPNDGYTVEDATNDENALRASAFFGTMAISTEGEISPENALGELSQFINIDLDKVRELQRNDGNNLFYILPSDEDIFDRKEALTESELAAVNAAVSEFEELMKNVVVTEQKFPKLSFTTVDFYGNPITSEECFSSNKVTLLNIWASYCGPCESEMPELVKANDIVSKEGCQVLLCLYDTDDRNSSEYQDAIGLLERAGASNLKCIIVNDEIKKQLDKYVLGYPASFPVGSDGQVLGTRYTGERSVDSFVDWIYLYK